MGPQGESGRPGSRVRRLLRALVRPRSADAAECDRLRAALDEEVRRHREVRQELEAFRRQAGRQRLLERLDELADDPRPPVVVVSSVDWNIPQFQRYQQLALALAATGRPTLYVTPNRLDAVAGCRRVGKHCHLADDLSLCLDRLSRFTLLVYSPVRVPLDLRQLRDRGDRGAVVYDVFDELHPDVFGELSEETWACHDYLLRHADLVTVSADRLARQVAGRRGRPVLLCPNGADVAHFRRPVPPPLPADLEPVRARGGLIVGYFGALAKWFDYDLLRRVATDRPGYEVVLLGQDYDGSLGQSGVCGLPNVHYLGLKPYADLPAYAAHFDAALIPFRVNDVTLATSPIKQFEYMAARKPVVATDLPECRKYRSVFVGRDPADFVVKLDQALRRRHDPAYLALLDREADENSWQRRAVDLSAALDTITRAAA